MDDATRRPWTPKSTEEAKKEGEALRDRLNAARRDMLPLTAEQWSYLEDPGHFERRNSDYVFPPMRLVGRALDPLCRFLGRLIDRRRAS